MVINLVNPNTAVQSPSFIVEDLVFEWESLPVSYVDF